MEISALEFESLLEQLLRSGVSVRFAARGGSMSPAIRHNEIVIVAPIGAEPVHPGEIVLVVSQAEGMLIHRVIEVDGELPASRIITRGDSQQFADRPVHHGEILGKVIRVEKGANS